MIDLINKNQHSLTQDEVNQLNALVDKYIPVLNELNAYEKTLAPYLAYVIDNTINYVNENHNELNADWKTWCVVCMKICFYKNKLNDINEIPELVDKFVNHYRKNYQTFLDSIEFSSSDLDRDFQFVSRYINR